ncbi:MAG: IPT/TIG domain-containing protein [Ferruginibacter sp.]
MTVRIKEKEFEYVSDFPSGWNFAGGDYFKFPVVVGGFPCFIKRFQRKTMEEVPGWELLLSLKGKNEQNIPRLYDIINSMEDGRQVYYVFFEGLEGDTLDTLIDAKENIDLVKMTEDMFRAFQSIHKKNYWVADFAEKNIFREKDGRFLLVDLDNTQPTYKLPVKDIIGKNNYWILIFNFYREVLQQRNLNPDDINGASMNYLQLVFLMLRLKLFQSANEDYYSEELSRNLPASLDESSSLFKDIYKNIFRNSELALQSREIGQIKMLVIGFLPTDDLQEPETDAATEEAMDLIFETPEPVIDYFTLSNYEPDEEGIYFVDNGSPFYLNWEVRNAVNIELYKNGAPYLPLDAGQKNIKLKEFSDGRKSDIIYKLVAINGDAQAVNSSLRLQVKKETAKSTVIEDIVVDDLPENNSNEYAINDSEPVTGNSAIDDNAVKNGEEYILNSRETKAFDLPVNHFPGKEAEDNGLSRMEPAIDEFSILGYVEKDGDQYIVNSGEYFTLSWKVTNADNITVYKNGSPYKAIGNTQTLNLKEKAPMGEEEKAAYSILATNRYTMYSSNTLTVFFKKDVEARPEITAFQTDNYVVEKLEPFNLAWRVKNVTRLELTRNGELYKILDPGDEIIRLAESFDTSGNTIIYRLTASDGSSRIDSEPIAIELKTRVKPSTPNWPLYLKIGSVVLGVLLIFFAGKWGIVHFKRPNATVENIAPQNLYEDSVITIYGERFSESRETEIFFNDVEGKIISSANDSLVVVIPDLKNKILAKGDVTVTVKANGYDIFSRNLQWFDKRAVAVREIKTTNFYNDSTVAVYFRNLNDPGRVKVYFNYTRARIKYQGQDSLVAIVPENFIADSAGNSINVNVKDGITTIYTYSFTPK